MNFYRLIMPLILLMATSHVALGAEEAAGEPITYDVGQRLQIHSQLLAEDRQLLVHLPGAYQTSEDDYPVIYVLDGNNHFRHAVTAATLLQQNNLMPPSIIVAIPNVPGKRGRDLGSERKQFLRFIKEELVVFIEENYRTLPHRTLFGHSMAGAFVLDTLLKDAAWFDSYIVASPAIGERTVARFEQYIDQNKPLNLSLYFTMAGAAAEGPDRLQAANQLVALLEQKAPKTLSWHYRHLPLQVHMTTPYLTFFEGLVEASSGD